MTLNEFIDNLASGELSNLALGEEAQIKLTAADRAKVVRWINIGLKAICSQFAVVKKDTIIQLYEHITNYFLRDPYARNNKKSTANPKYIDDLPHEPFKNDLVKVLFVRDIAGIELPLNVKGDRNSLMTPQFDVLYVPRPANGIVLSVNYQATHAVIEDCDGGCKDINLPPYLEEALMLYVASKAYSQMNGPGNLAKSKDLMGQYLTICANVKTQDQVGESEINTNTKLEDRGFV